MDFHPAPQLSTATATPVPEKYEKLQKAAQSVESFFLYQMLELTQPEQDPNNPFSGGHAETLFRGKMNEIMANEVAQTGATGISDSIYAELVKQQEAAQ